MRNLKPTSQIPLLFLDRIGKVLKNGCKNKNKTNYNAVKGVLKNCFKEYNSKLVPINLESLVPYGNFTVEQKHTVKHLYESGKNEFDQLWEELKDVNGGSVLRCPICGISFATELDHYAPRDLFPEFSANPLNIIPLCHDCNNSKWEKWTSNGCRLIFNAYFDDLPRQKILKCEINNIINDLPIAEVSLCNLRNPSKAETIIKSTIEQLKLVDYYNSYVNKDLVTNIAHLQDEYAVKRPVDNAAFWNEKKIIYVSYLNNQHRYSEEQLLLYEALTNSPVFDAWIVNNF